MIVKVELTTGEIWLFGNSYKDWATQCQEFFWRFPDGESHIKNVESCRDKWIGWGGLKWCQLKNFQEKLNREGCQESDNDNPNARQLAQMVFRKSPHFKNKIKEFLVNGKNVHIRNLEYRVECLAKKYRPNKTESKYGKVGTN